MAPSSKKTMYHEHPLTEVCSDTEFLCDGCRTLGSDRRYRCRPCDFDLHEYCANCPMELSSFMHKHDLKLVARKPQMECTNERICDLCRDPVEGLFYRCKMCEFDVHPLCTQLPEHVRHVLHKEHPLRLQKSVPGLCVVCKDICDSWHYRCSVCSFDIHIECVLEPCEEVVPKMSMVTSSSSSPSPSTSRSLGTIAPQPPQQQQLSPSPFLDVSLSPLLDAYLAANMGYGAMIRPQPYFACNYGVPYGSPVALAPYGHGHGHGHALAMPSAASGYGDSVVNVNNTPQQGNSSQIQHGGGSGGKAAKVRKKMYAIAGNLALGVISNVLFGAIFS